MAARKKLKKPRTLKQQAGDLIAKMYDELKDEAETRIADTESLLKDKDFLDRVLREVKGEMIQSAQETLTRMVKDEAFKATTAHLRTINFFPLVDDVCHHTAERIVAGLDFGDESMRQKMLRHIRNTAGSAIPHNRNQAGDIPLEMPSNNVKRLERL
jgi:hypothetical protein